MNRLAIILVLVIASPSEAATFRWPWEVRHDHNRYKRHEVHRSDKSQVTPFAEPETNCAEILEAEKTLGGTDGARWKYQLSMLTDGQRANIAKCLKDAIP